MKNIGFAVRHFREKIYPGHGGQKKAAQDMGIKRPAWNKYENSDRLSLPILEKIAALLGVTVDDIISKAEENHTDTLGAENSPSAAADGEHESIDIDVQTVEGIKNATIIRHLLDTAQEATLSGELSSGDFLTLSRSLLTSLRSGLASHRSIHQRTKSGKDSGA